jgi:hypothetical protein
VRLLVIVLSLSLALPALADLRAPVHADALERLGVMPLRVTGKNKKKNRKDAALYFKLLVEVLEQERGDTVSLANPRERTFKPRKKKSLLRAVRKRGQAAGVTRVLTGTVQGRGSRQLLALELFDVTGHTISKYRVKPYKRMAAEWVTEAMHALQLQPPPAQQAPAEPEPVSAAERPEVAAGDPEPGAAPEASSAALWWSVGSISAGALGAAALTGGGLFGAAAWDESEELIKLAPGDPERTALEESSINKAITADALFASGAVLVGASIASGVMAALAAGEGT